MDDIKILPNYLKSFLSERNIIKINSYISRPPGFDLGIRLTGYYGLSQIAKNICNFFNLESSLFEYTLFRDLGIIETLKQKRLLDDAYIHIDKYQQSLVIFKSLDSAKSFISNLNGLLKTEYDIIEDILKVNLFLTGKNPDDYVQSNVIFTSRTLGEHFIEQFKIPYFFRTLEIVDITRNGFLALEAKVRFHTEICGQCHLCGKPLKDNFSKETGIGSTCARKKLGIKSVSASNIKDTISQIKSLTNSIGVIGPIVLPKKQIRKL